MKKKIFFTALLTAGLCGIISAHNKDKNKGNPGNDTTKDNQAKSAAAKPAAGATSTPAASKQKVTTAPKQTETYENKAPSVFTFTVLSTYLKMPIQKK